MKILLIILSIIGLLKLVSLFILCIIETYYYNKQPSINGITKQYGVYKDDSWYIIPTIRVSKCNKYFEIMVEWLCFQYYSAYNIDKDEPSSV
jgi:hypothetical protein